MKYFVTHGRSFRCVWHGYGRCMGEKKSVTLYGVSFENKEMVRRALPLSAQEKKKDSLLGRMGISSGCSILNAQDMHAVDGAVLPSHPVLCFT